MTRDLYHKRARGVITVSPWSYAMPTTRSQHEGGPAHSLWASAGHMDGPYDHAKGGAHPGLRGCALILYKSGFFYSFGFFNDLCLIFN
jgi:hypothetical protein